MKGKVVALWTLLLAAGIASRPARAEGKITREYDLKAAFLFNFAQFVAWPADSFADPQAPFTIGVLGKDPFGKSLDEIVANESIGNRRLVVRRYRTVDEVGSCQILFIGELPPADLNGVRAGLARKSILTVGETENFADRFGVIGFVMAENKIRLQINLETARVARLTISSKLLRQAELVGGGSNK